MEKSHSPSCERNKDPIQRVLSIYIGKDQSKKESLLEIGSGTGQHASYFSPVFKNLIWVPSDSKENHSKILEWTSSTSNIEKPLSYMAGTDSFPKGEFNFVFTANSLHIMSWKEAKTLFKQLGQSLKQGTKVFIYGPFNYNGKFTSESNETFDQWLKERNPKSGIRAFSDVVTNMSKNGFSLLEDHEMPANNRFLIFEKDI